MLHTLALTLALSAAPDADKSSAAVQALTEALAAKPADLAKLADKDFATVQGRSEHEGKNNLACHAAACPSYAR